MSIISKAIPLCFILFITINVSHAQVIYSGSKGLIFLTRNEDKSTTLVGKRGGYFKDHPFGDRISKSYNTFMVNYVAYEVEEGPYPTERKVIEKPEIYKAILDIEKNLKKQVKKGDISRIDAADRLEKVLETANKVRVMHTEELEEVLEEMKSVEDKERVLSSIRFES